jgi:hypothetical protein
MDLGDFSMAAGKEPTTTCSRLTAIGKSTRERSTRERGARKEKGASSRGELSTLEGPSRERSFFRKQGEERRARELERRGRELQRRRGKEERRRGEEERSGREEERPGRGPLGEELLGEKTNSSWSKDLF